MPITLGEEEKGTAHYISKSAARKLLVSFNRTIKGTTDEPKTIRGISKMTDQGLIDSLKGFSIKKGIGKNKGKDILKHKQVISKRYSEVIPKDYTRKPSEKKKKKKGTKGAKSKTDPGTEDYTGKKGDISKSEGKDVKSENKKTDFYKAPRAKLKKIDKSKVKKKGTFKKKLSDYNKHIAKEMKGGKTMKEAAKTWKTSPMMI
tara:strand:- start:356 stop:964 length:609 start_codon:yes stop_codon:yes gene_type:complete